MKSKVIELIESCNISYEKYEHEPILDYEKAEEVAARLGFTGTESKSLFLKGKSGNYYVFVTTKGEKLDAKVMKNLVGEKVSICSGEEMQTVVHCVPGCVAPFGYEDDISLIIDQRVFQEEKLIFSPGIPKMTLIIKGSDFKTILEHVENRIYYL